MGKVRNCSGRQHLHQGDALQSNVHPRYAFNGSEVDVGEYFSGMDNPPFRIMVHDAPVGENHNIAPVEKAIAIVHLNFCNSKFSMELKDNYQHFLKF